MEQSRKRKAKENKPVLAICYDFDKTLSPDDKMCIRDRYYSISWRTP